MGRCGCSRRQLATAAETCGHACGRDSGPLASQCHGSAARRFGSLPCLFGPRGGVDFAKRLRATLQTLRIEPKSLVIRAASNGEPRRSAQAGQKAPPGQRRHRRHSEVAEAGGGARRRQRLRVRAFRAMYISAQGLLGRSGTSRRLVTRAASHRRKADVGNASVCYIRGCLVSS